MRPKSLLIALVLVFSSAHAWSAESLRLVGGGAIIAASPYRGVGVKTTALPLIRWDYKNFYIKGAELGYSFYKTEDVTVGIFGSPRFMGYHSGDSGALTGMDDRENSFDMGLAADYKFSGWGRPTIGVRIVSDAGGVSEGQAATLSFSKKFSSKYFEVTPSLGARLQSASMVDYYYGVTAREAAADRPEYEPGAAVNYFTDVMFNFGIHPRWIVITKVGVEFLDREITRSPIVGRDYLVTGIVGLTRRF